MTALDTLWALYDDRAEAIAALDGRLNRSGRVVEWIE